MMFVLYIVGILLAVLKMLLFDAAKMPMIVTILICAAGLIVFIFQNKMPKAAAGILQAVTVILTCICLVFTGESSSASVFALYNKSLEGAEEYLKEGELDQAVKVLEAMEEKYGMDDNMVFLRTIELLEKEDYENAYAEVERMQDKKSVYYYAAKEQIFIQDPSKESVENIYRMYQEAADVWSDWTYMQLMNGVALFEQGDYKSALYYLEQAKKQEETNSRTLYYLGAVNYYLNDFDTSIAYFEKALEIGLDEEFENDIIWYVQNMEEEVQ